MLPKGRYKPTVTITDNFIRNTKLANNIFEEQLCNLHCTKVIVFHLARNVLHVFDKMFCDSHYGVTTFFSFRQVGHEINAIA